VAADLARVAMDSFLVALSGALMPGPVLAVTLAGSRRHGFWFGPLVVLGHGLVELPVVVLLALGLGAVLGTAWIVTGIGYVGAAALGWMAVGLLRQARWPQEAEGGEGGARLGAVGAGALTSMANPYWYLWWVSMGAVLLAGAAGLGWAGVAAFFVGHIAADLAWYSVVSLGVARGRRYFQGRAYKALLLVCALALAIMAGRFAYLAVSRTFGAA